jgi:tetratricopeptide (TPR) repeat protein
MESEFRSRPRADELGEGTRRRYTLRQVAEIANIPPRRLRAWIRAGLIQPIDSDGSDVFTFHEVRTASLLMKLARNGVGTARLRGILGQLRSRYANGREIFAQLDLFAGLLVIRDDDSRLAAPNGQLLLDLVPESDSTATVALRLDGADAADDAQGADDLFEQAVRLEQAGDPDGAARAYRQCLLQFGPELTTCFNLANVLSALGHTEAAVERYRQTVEIDPHYVAAWNNLGLGLAELGNADEAFQAWKRAVDIDPNSADALFNLADALQEASRFDEARPLWQAYLQLDGESEWSSYARFCLDGPLANESEHRFDDISMAAKGTRQRFVPARRPEL